LWRRPLALKAEEIGEIDAFMGNWMPARHSAAFLDKYAKTISDVGSTT